MADEDSELVAAGPVVGTSGVEESCPRSTCRSCKVFVLVDVELEACVLWLRTLCSFEMPISVKDGLSRITSSVA